MSATAHTTVRSKLEDFIDLKLSSKVRYVYALMRPNHIRKTILFYPQMPDFFHVMYMMCHQLGYTMTNDPTAHFDAAVAFVDSVGDATVHVPDKTLTELAQTYHVINMNCTDVSKTHVEEVFQQVFGYSTMLDPRTHRGQCVQKSNANAAHDGQVVSCPCEPKKGYVYQKLINNQQSGNKVMDIRIPYILGIIPFSSHRYRSLFDRFDNTEQTVMTNLEDDLNGEELEKINLFCKKIGLEYGDLDLLRDNDDGRLYIVDVNPSPAGPRPGKHMSRRDFHIFISLLSEAFSLTLGSK
jgi:hypothetical protein